jgi:hypothetical protein
VLAAGAGYGAYADSAAGKPVDSSVTLCGVGTLGQDVMEGSSDQSHPTPSSFSAKEFTAGTDCSNDNSTTGSDTWTVDHSNVNVVTERGTEHGIWQRPSAPPAGFNGHITDYDRPTAECVDSQDRHVYYQSGKETDCAPSYGPVGNFNTHGGAATGQHFRGNYGTIIFQQNSNTSHACDVDSDTYCIQVDLVGQTN